MNANPEKAIEIIAGICKENGQDPTLRSNFEVINFVPFKANSEL
jgi:hypothetical protein